LAAPLVCLGATPVRGDDVAPSATAKAGAVEGVVSYLPNAARPWRYARYYVKNAKTGELAEAVVALRGKGLRDAAPKPPAKTSVVDQLNFQFQPETTAIRQGDAVKFTNGDQAAHNVRASGAIADFNVTMPPAGDYTATFSRAGGIRQPVQIGCVFHSAMRAWVFVFDHPFFQLTGADGCFRLEGVPPGAYELEMSHPAGDLHGRKQVQIKAGETTRIDIQATHDDKE
jgi:plastocyanin